MKHISYAKIAVNKILDKTVGPLEAAILGIIVISTISYALAWQAPTGNPPAGNTDAPLNAGSTGQTKIGGLLLNSGGAPNGLIVQNGNVGIGTLAPGGKLDVRGDIRLHTDGSLYAPGGVENLRIIRGTINSDGTIRNGYGFTSTRYAAGSYRINFYTPFSAPPTIVVSAVGASSQGDSSPWFQVANLKREDEYVRTTSQFEVVLHYQQLSGTSDTYDRPWDFIAIGPR